MTKIIRDKINRRGMQLVQTIANAEDENLKKVLLFDFKRIVNVANYTYSEFKAFLKLDFHIDYCSYYTYKTLKLEAINDGYFAEMCAGFQGLL
jgi:hypothetical protein